MNLSPFPHRLSISSPSSPHLLIISPFSLIPAARMLQVHLSSWEVVLNAIGGWLGRDGMDGYHRSKVF